MNPFYSELAFNPLGASWVDLGLGGYPKRTDYDVSVYEPELGKFKVPTLRNVDTRPSAGFVKAYQPDAPERSAALKAHGAQVMRKTLG